MTAITALNTRFAIPDHVSFRQHPDGLILLDVNNTQATASIALQGAQLLTWTPDGASPVIWLSAASRFVPGKAIRGGVPLCWPWFGPHASETSFPSHGIARTAPWELLTVEQPSDAITRLVFRLSIEPAAQAYWPYASVAEMHMRIGKTLELELVTQNTGNTPFSISTALHSYFAVGDVRLASIHGLDGCRYIDKLANGKRERQSGPVVIHAETDRIYLDSGDDCLIDDPSLNRRIRIEKRGSRSSVVWNPWQEKSAALPDMQADGYQQMLCLESGNVADDQVQIAANAEHRLWVRYSVEPRLGA